MATHRSATRVDKKKREEEVALIAKVLYDRSIDAYSHQFQTFRPAPATEMGRRIAAVWQPHLHDSDLIPILGAIAGENLLRCLGESGSLNFEANTVLVCTNNEDDGDVPRDEVSYIENDEGYILDGNMDCIPSTCMDCNTDHVRVATLEEVEAFVRGALDKLKQRFIFVKG